MKGDGSDQAPRWNVDDVRTPVVADAEQGVTDDSHLSGWPERGWCRADLPAPDTGGTVEPKPTRFFVLGCRHQ